MRPFLLIHAAAILAVFSSSILLAQTESREGLDADASPQLFEPSHASDFDPPPTDPVIPPGKNPGKAVVIETERPGPVVPYISYLYDYFHNVSGGFQAGGAGMGLVDMGFEADLEALFGWDRTIFVMTAFAGHGSDFTANYVGDLGVVSNIYTDTNFNLYNIYLQKGFGPGDSYFKVGQIAADDEFMGSETAGLFINSAFAPFNTQSANTASPIFPLAAPGGVVHFHPNEDWFCQVGLYVGDAGPGGPTGRGFEWRWGGAAGVVVFAEGGVVWNEAGGIVKVGGYHHTGDYEQFATGNTVEGLDAAWVIVDQPIIDGGDGGLSLSAFARGSIAPDEDRSVATSQVDGGLALSNFLLPEAVFGIGLTHTTFGDDYLAATPGVTSSETVVEATYQIPITDCFTIQPDVQWILDPHESGRDAVAVGIRGEISF